jgi:hypothetical protein
MGLGFVKQFTVKSHFTCVDVCVRVLVHTLCVSLRKIITK